MSWRTSARIARQRDSRWWLGAGMVAVSAAAAVYFLDPEHGRARRTRVADRTMHAMRTARRRTVRELAYARNTAEGRWQHLTGGREPEVLEGPALLDRVESELFTDPTIPHGRLTFEVEGTTVILRGEIDSEAEMERIEAAVRAMPGVSKVASLLHRPGTPAPNKQAALVASANAVSEERESQKLD